MDDVARHTYSQKNLLPLSSKRPRESLSVNRTLTMVLVVFVRSRREKIESQSIEAVAERMRDPTRDPHKYIIPSVFVLEIGPDGV